MIHGREAVVVLLPRCWRRCLIVVLGMVKGRWLFLVVVLTVMTRFLARYLWYCKPRAFPKWLSRSSAMINRVAW
jgi:hypothetical protein